MTRHSSFFSAYVCAVSGVWAYTLAIYSYSLGPVNCASYKCYNPSVKPGPPAHIWNYLHTADTSRDIFCYCLSLFLPLMLSVVYLHVWYLILHVCTLSCSYIGSVCSDITDDFSRLYQVHSLVSVHWLYWHWCSGRITRLVSLSLKALRIDSMGMSLLAFGFLDIISL